MKLDFWFDLPKALFNISDAAMINNEDIEYLKILSNSNDVSA
jgi:hypothetical protein